MVKQFAIFLFAAEMTFALTLSVPNWAQSAQQKASISVSKQNPDRPRLDTDPNEIYVRAWSWLGSNDPYSYFPVMANPRCLVIKYDAQLFTIDDDPRFLIIKVNGKAVTGMFMPHQPDSYCSRKLLQELGVPITVPPTKYSNEWKVQTGYAGLHRGEGYYNFADHVVDKIWILPLDVTVGTVTRRSLPVVVEQCGYDTLDHEGYDNLGVDLFVIGSDFFKPGKFEITGATINYQGQLLATIDRPQDYARYYRNSDGTLPVISEQEMERVDAESLKQKIEVEKQFPKQAKLGPPLLKRAFWSLSPFWQKVRQQHQLL